MPANGRVSEIVPLVKKPRKEMTMSNIRPISLHAATSKLLMKGLAKRLNKVFAKNRVLHPAQEAFLLGGSTHKCVEVVVDIWEEAKSKGRGCYNIFYDLAGAYDSVTHESIERSMHRLRMPPAFVELIMDSLSGLTAFVRTGHGPTETFDVQRSLKQGCPIAPLCCVMVLDPLHCQMGGECIASKGFADDTWARRWKGWSG
jgi:hypothetical protein